METKSGIRMKWDRQLASAIDFYPSSKPHFCTLTSIIESWFDLTEHRLSTLNAAMRAHGETLEVGMLDSAGIEGYAQEDPVSPFVQLSLGLFPKALALTNRSHVARVLGAHDPVTFDVFGAGPPIKFKGFERWSMKNTSVGVLNMGPGTVYLDTLNSVSDCATLALLHEVSHTQEPFSRSGNEAHSKAVEACADEGSGYLFVRALQRENDINRSVQERIIVDRLADAAFFLSAMVFWSSRDAGLGAGYHHPWTRMRCFFRGACFALFGADTPRWRAAYSRVYERQWEYCLALAVFTPDELWFWREHEALNADWREFLTVTFPKMTEMRRSLTRPSLLTPITQGMHFCVG